MSLLAEFLYFATGFLIAFVFPRIPSILITRGSAFNKHFPPHPDAMPLSPYLTQRVLHMRMFYWLGLVVSIIPITFGLLSLKWGNTSFGFGLWLSSGWFVIARLQVFIGGKEPPWTLEMAQTLQLIMVEKHQTTPCCSYPSYEWRILSISCASCNSIIEEMPRPDLGRKRMDGFFLGGLRLLITDGYPILESQTNEQSKISDSEE